MKANELIATLTDAVAQWGNCDVWIGTDILLQPTVIELLEEPDVEAPAIVIGTTDKSGTDENNVRALPIRS